MIVLTSNGLSSPTLICCVKDFVKAHNLHSALICVTSDPHYKKEHKHLNRLMSELHECGLKVSLFDFDTDDFSVIENVELIEFIGGNPFYLLDRLRTFNVKPLLRSMHQNNKVIIGISAGSFVLQQNIDLVNVYTPQMNTVAMDHFEGMGLVDVEILPHFSKYCNRFENFEQRCVDYERYKNIHVMRINDGEGVLIRDNNIGIRI